MDVDPTEPDPVAGFILKHGLPGLIHLHKHDNPMTYEEGIAKGHKTLEKHIKAAFAEERLPDEDLARQRKHIDDWMSQGGIDNDIQHEVYSQADGAHFAEGGEVHKEAKPLHSGMIADTYPGHNLGMQAAKTRMSQYLNTLRPTTMPTGLPFDAPQNNTEQMRQYAKARDLAAHPMDIMKSLNKGTLVPQDVAHFKMLHPEIDNVLQKELTKKVFESQLSGKRPSYKMRQSLSLLLGAPLSADMLPQNIQAAQATFQKAPPAEGQGGGAKPKHSTAKLSKSDQAFLTGTQARVMREQKQ